jgi:hypothetical protein
MTSKSWIHNAGRRWRPAGIALAALLIALLAPSAATAQIAKRASTTAANGNGGASSLSVNAPAAIAGDLLLAQVAFEKGSDATVSPQGLGWNHVQTTSRSSDVGQALYWKQATAGEPLSYAWNFTKGGSAFSVRASGGVTAYSGVDMTAPIVAWSEASGDKNPLTAPTVNASAESMLVALFGIQKQANLSVPRDASGALMTDVYFQQHPNQSGPAIRAGQEPRSAGATGARLSTATRNGSNLDEKWVGQLVVLRGGDNAVPTAASITIDDRADWTTHADGSVTVDISGRDNRGVANYRLAPTEEALDTAPTTTVDPAQATFTKTDLAFTLAGAEGPDKAAWVRICDAAGNCADAGDTIGWDRTGPVVAGTKTPGANGLGWHNDAVSIAWTAIDAGVGIDSDPTPASDSVTADTAGVTKTATATDKLGNVGRGEVVVKLDKTRPSIHPTRQPEPNEHGWNNTDVSVGFTCSDVLSGIRSCTGGGTVTVTTEGAGQTTPGTAIDNADNENDDGVTGINIDKTPPVLTGAPTTAPNDNGWYRGDVTIEWAASDALSGLVGDEPAAGTIGGEGAALTATESVEDKAGNVRSTTTAAVKIDRTAPATSAEAVDWTNLDEVTVELEPNDGLSGVESTSYSIDGGPAQSGTRVSITDEGLHALAFSSTDNAGNVEATKTITVKVDRTAPGITHAIRPAANGRGWHREDVTVEFTCTDGLSGVASCTADQVVSEEVEAHKVTGTAIDTAGNWATDDAFVSLDKTRPTIRAAVDRPANGNGWYDADVIVGFACDDNLSGAIDCPAAETLGEGENQAARGSVLDAAGNSASDEVTDIDVDKTAPMLAGAATTEPNDEGWYSGDVVVAWSASDALSGLAGATPADVTVEGEGANRSASATVYDNAGNSTTTTVDGIRIDRTAPVTTVEVADPLGSGWYGGAVEVTLTAHDSLSGPARTMYTVGDGEPQRYSGPFAFAADGVHQIGFWSLDKAGNAESETANRIELKIDGVAPGISASRSPAGNANGWNNTPVTVTFACVDAHSGFDTCGPDATVSDEGAGQSVTGHAMDLAGNTASATLGDINIDLTQPTLTGQATRRPNDHGWYNDAVTVAWTAADELSGLDGDAPAESVIDGEGDNLTATASVEDKAGNVRSTVVDGIRIDRTKPETTASKPEPYSTGWYAGAVKVILTGSDDRAGVDRVLYGIDGGETQTYDEENGVVVGEKGMHTIRYWSVDKAGNADAAKSIDVWIDGIKPTISAKRTEASAANEHGWNNGDVVIHFECADGETDIASCDPDGILTNEGADQWVTGTAVDVAGNSAGYTFGGVNIDRTAPTLTSRPTTDANADGWYRDDVSIEWTAVDGLSGIDPATHPADSMVSGEGDTLSATASVKDKAGNEGHGFLSGIKIDRTPPTIDGAPTTLPNDAGWYRDPVTVAFTCDDGLSGVASCPTDATVAANMRDQSVTSGPATDRAGNTAAGKRVDGISIDGDAPTTLAETTCTRVNEWCTGDTATVTLTATDQLGLSGTKEIHYRINGGVEQVAEGQTALVAVPLNGEGEATVRYWAVDYADNAEVVNTAGVKWDNIAPVVTPVLSPMPNLGGWNRELVTVGFLATDTGSGVKPGSVTPDVVVSSETASEWVLGEAFDNADNKGSAKAEVKLDMTAPGIQGAVKAGTEGENGWYTGPVTVGFTCDDSLSGVATCAAPVTVGANQAGQSATGAAVDNAGNTSSAAVDGIDIDAVRPAITLEGIAPGAIYTLGAVPTASCTSNDELSGADGCDVTVTGGVASGAGTFSYTATAKDRAGNIETVQGSYRVIYRWNGFGQPINDTAHQVGTSTSIFKAGSTVPVKFELRRADGTVVQPALAPKWITPVKGSATSAAVDESLYSVAADSGSTFRLAGGQWHYNWASPKAGAGNYWRIGAMLDDGQTYYVNIGLR